MIVVLFTDSLGASTPGCCRLRQPAPLREKSSSSVDQRGRTRARSRRVGLRSICRRELRCATDQKAASAAFGVGNRDQHLGERSREFAGDFALRALRRRTSHIRSQCPHPHPRRPPMAFSRIVTSRKARGLGAGSRESRSATSAAAAHTRGRGDATRLVRGGAPRGATYGEHGRGAGRPSHCRIGR